MRENKGKILKIGKYYVNITVGEGCPLLYEKKMKESFPQLWGGGHFMCKACEIGKVVINKCYEQKFNIGTAKLQKLLVLMQGEHLAKYGKPIFPEEVLCWKCGVAIKEVELKFLPFDYSIKENIPINIAVLQSEEWVIKDVLNKYGNLDVLDINKDIRLTELVNKYPYQEGIKTIIPKDEIKRVFSDL